MPGILYIVPTPIGNLKDITLRALEILRSVDLIMAEDTRKSGILLKHYQISKPLKSYHNFNEHRQLNRVINLLIEGKSLALISDAGTPLVSDPGYLLVREAINKEIPVQTLPGPIALVPALINSGLPTDKFVFEGFLPHKKGRRSRMEALANEERTIIFYESPHRLLKTLNQLAEHLGELRQAAVSREISKVYEETIRGSLKFLIGFYSEKKVKGEIVIVVAGKSGRT